MRFAPLVAALLLTVVTVPAMAQSACTEPVMPAPVDGATITVDQLRAAIADAKNFIAQSDVFQNCIVSEADAAKTQAASEGKNPDPALAGAAQARVAASQKNKEKVGVSINTAITTYKQAHPN